MEMHTCHQGRVTRTTFRVRSCEIFIEHLFKWLKYQDFTVEIEVNCGCRIYLHNKKSLNVCLNICLWSLIFFICGNILME